MEREQLLLSCIKKDNEYEQYEEARRKDFAEKLSAMHAENLKANKLKAESQKKLEYDIDQMAVKDGIRIADNYLVKRKNEILEQQRRNAESEKMSALAAQGITQQREREKERLTIVNCNKHRMQEEH